MPVLTPPTLKVFRTGLLRHKAVLIPNLVVGMAVMQLSTTVVANAGMWNCEATLNGQWRCGRTLAESASTEAQQRAEGPMVTPSNNLDWVATTDMTEHQKAKVSANCCGGYVEPERNYPDAELNPAQSAIRFSANSTEALDNNVAVLEGDVQVSQGYRQVRSDRAYIDQKSRKVILQGNVQFREPGILLLGSEAELNSSSREIQIKDTTYLLHEASIRGSATRLTRTEDERIVINDATYSTCQPDDTAWKFVTNEISIDQREGFATVKNARLEISDIPVFYFPWVTFPINDQRSSGLLFPTISANSKNGVDILQPIYWNLAPQYDVTFLPRYLSERGLALGAEFRHLTQWSETTINSSWLPNDRGGRESERIDPMTGRSIYAGEDRYIASLEHRGGNGSPWSAAMDFNYVSDSDYFTDLGDMSSLRTNQTHLERRSALSYRKGHWTYGLASEDYQRISERVEDHYALLPKIYADAYYRFDHNLTLNIAQSYSYFHHRDESRVQGSRRNLEYSLTWNKLTPWGYIKPKAEFRHIGYALQNTLTPDDNPSISAPAISIDSVLFLERDASPLGQFTQTLEPRVYYLKRKFQDQSRLPDFDSRIYTPSYDNLFRDNRYSGGDRLSDEHRVTLALTSRFIDKKTGQERLQLSLAQALHLDDRQVVLQTTDEATGELNASHRNQSPLALRFSALIDGNWRVNSELIYDNHDNNVEKNSVTLRYKNADQQLVNLTYRHIQKLPQFRNNVGIDQDIRQIDLSSFLPLKRNVTWIARWNYDLTHHRPLEIFAGFEYNSCCWRASLVARRHLQRDDDIFFPEEHLEAENSILVQIQFKGLAGAGGPIDSILQKGIYGYEKRDDF